MQLLKNKYMPILLSIVWAIMSYFISDWYFFAAITSSNIINYTGCKMIASLIVYCFIRFCFHLIENHGMTDHEWKSAKLTVPIAVIYLFCTFFFLHIETKGYTVMTGDTRLIYDRAIQLECYNDFHFLTSWCYIVALMFNPTFPNFIVYFKTIIWIIFINYVFYRIVCIVDKYDKFYIKTKKGQALSFGLIYFIFLFMPIIEMITNCHRIYWYVIFYGMFFAVLSFDYLEEKKLNHRRMIFLSVLAACISQWRTEGIIISIVFPLLLICVYKNMKIKMIAKGLLFLLLSNVLVFVPQNIETFAGRTHYSDVRLHPLYSYRITLMLKEGLDRDLYADELHKIDKVISIAAIDRLNADYGEKSYLDGFIRWKEGYVGVREAYQMDYYRAYVKGSLTSGVNGFCSDEYMEYAKACKKIFKRNIPLYLKTCMKTFGYVEKYGFKDGSGEHRLKIGNIVARFEYSLIIMIIITCFLLVAGAVKNNKFWLFYALAVLSQVGIVFLLSPSAYYKYYFPMCFASIMGMVMYILMYMRKKRIIGDENE